MVYTYLIIKKPLNRMCLKNISQKSMRRFWIDPSCRQGETFFLSGPLFHHVCRVSRIQKGESFELLCGGYVRYEVKLDSVSRLKATARIIKSHPAPPLDRPYLHLALSLPRLHKLDSILEKAVELGVKDFHPFISQLSFFKEEKQVPLNRLKRWENLISKASAISGRTQAFTLHPVCKLKDIRIPKNHKALMAYEGTAGKSLHKVLEKTTSAEEIWLFVGSEGGFSRKESEEFAEQGGEVFSFGDQILRVETACLMGLSVLKYHYHQKGR